MIDINKRSNLLEQEVYHYSLQNVEDPNLYRDLFPYSEIPKVSFNHRRVPMEMPDEIWITDTTFRDGQQAREPYTPGQVLDLFDMLHRLGGENGIVRQTEFFIYSEKDRKALELCRERGYRFPEITTWIRATKGDFKLVRDIGIEETGILTSCSDYHIFNKLGTNRAKAIEQYISVVSQALEMGIKPRCHLEDITRADIYGFVLPFVGELMRLSKESKIPIKIRACDTMGYGVCYTGASLPRSVPGIIYGLKKYCGVPSSLIEWHGHNDFYKGVVNAATAWLFGCSAVNCSLLGIGERTGNVPLEAMVMEYASLRGGLSGMDASVITEIADYYSKELNYKIPAQTPFVGKNFNVTRAGIHADGLLKDEEIYNIFDTGTILKRPANVLVSNVSGLAGIAYWLNGYYGLVGGEKIDKRDAICEYIKKWIDAEYENGRTTVISDEELEKLAEEYKSGQNTP
ncbi:MAG: 2-isopropylmalate synthase [Oscillospiraceae bacterium]|nr:2-isopropylmalate synthase [Oscillospiraceae bacterium]